MDSERNTGHSMIRMTFLTSSSGIKASSMGSIAAPTMEWCYAIHPDFRRHAPYAGGVATSAKSPSTKRGMRSLSAVDHVCIGTASNALLTAMYTIPGFLAPPVSAVVSKVF
jgi:hypothetical protein